MFDFHAGNFALRTARLSHLTRAELIPHLRGHYSECGECYSKVRRFQKRCGYLAHDTTGCSEALVIAQALIEADEEEGFRPASHQYGLSWYFESGTDFHEWQAYDACVAEYAADTSHTRVTDRWEELEPELDDSAWDESQVRRYSREDEADVDLIESIVLHSQIESGGTYATYIDQDVRSLDLFRAHGRIWHTRQGQVAIYKTFIQQVVRDEDSGKLLMTAYCAPCKAKRVMEVTERNVVATFLHAHTHVENSIVVGDTESFGEAWYTFEGTEATPAPGEDPAADLKFVRNWAQRQVDEAKIRARESGKYKDGPDALTQAWITTLTTEPEAWPAQPAYREHRPAKVERPARERRPRWKPAQADQHVSRDVTTADRLAALSAAITNAERVNDRLTAARLWELHARITRAQQAAG